MRTLGSTPARQSRNATRVRRAIGPALVVALVVAVTPAAASEPSVSAGGWEPVQQLANRQLSIDGAVVTRAGTSVVAWSRGGRGYDSLVYTSVRRAGDSAWSDRLLLPGGRYTPCAPGIGYPARECYELVTGGDDDVVLFEARESSYEAPEHDLSVQRLAGTSWVPLDDIHVPAPTDQVKGAIDDQGNYAVVWLDDGSTVGGASSTQGGPWADLPALQLPAGNQNVSHLQLRNDGAIVAVLHNIHPDTGRVSYLVATLIDGKWTVDRVQPTKSWAATPPLVASAPTGALAIGWAEQRPSDQAERVFARVRPVGATEFAPKAQLSDDWHCQLNVTYCAHLGILDSGKVAALWYAYWPYSVVYGSTYDPGTDEWAPRTTLIDKRVEPFFDIHPDGTVVMDRDGSTWICEDVTVCAYVDSADFFADQGGDVDREYVAGPNGSAVGFARHERCGESSCVNNKLQASKFAPADS